MRNINEILGTYIAYETDVKSPFWNKFELKLSLKNEQIFFSFEMTTEGNVGKIGKLWEGRGYYRADHLALVIEAETDWTYTSDDNQISKFTSKKNESLPIEIYTDNNVVVVYHKFIDRFVELKKQNT